MNAISLRPLRAACAFLALLVLYVPGSRGQSKTSDEPAIVAGTVCDSQNKPVGDVTISLESDSDAHKFVAHSDAQGRYRFEAVPPGSYTLRANKAGYLDKTQGPFVVQQEEVKSFALQLSARESSAFAKDALSSLEFSEEPHFNVSGVTDPTNLGGHRSAHAHDT